MAWGYSPRPVIKRRQARLSAEKSKGPGFLLVMVGICAAIFVFGLISEIMRPGEKEKQEDLMIRLNDEITDTPTEVQNGHGATAEDKGTAGPAILSHPGTTIRWAPVTNAPYTEERSLALWEKHQIEEELRRLGLTPAILKKGSIRMMKLDGEHGEIKKGKGEETFWEGSR